MHTVVVVGSGGRESALAFFLKKSPLVSSVIVTAAETSADTIVSFNPDLVVIGPEAPLAAGLVDELKEKRINVFGPTKAAAMLETSKCFAKMFMKQENIPTAEFECFNLPENQIQARAYIQSMYASGKNVVVKASGLAAGKGVLIPNNLEEALSALDEIQLGFKEAASSIVIEECLDGFELSVMAFCDGDTLQLMPCAQDHKRAMSLDRGLNTGGMGAFAPVPGISVKLLEDIRQSCLAPVLLGMKRRGTPFIGVLFAGIMVTSDGPMVLEFNTRFGDPETQTVLPLLQSDLFNVLHSCTSQDLALLKIQWDSFKYAVSVVAASDGYPGSYSKDHLISGLNNFESQNSNVFLFTAGVKVLNDENYTNGGRVLAVTGLGKSLEDASGRAYNALDGIQFHGKIQRFDIAAKRFAPINIAVLGSTRGTSLQGIIDAINCGCLSARISCVISDRKSAGILGRAQKHGIPYFFIGGKGKSREAFDAEVLSVLDAEGSGKPDLILLIGFMRIISSVLIEKFSGKILNVHPSLLPKFSGGMDLDVHEQVIAAGEKESGCTIHYVDKDVDAGDVVLQRYCPVLPGDSPQTLKARVQKLESEALCECIVRYQQNRLVGAPQKITYADSGVSILSGNSLVEEIKPIAKLTSRPGCSSSLGGFGAVFDLKKAGFADPADPPLLISTTDGVGTKLKIAQAANMHNSIGIDLVAMCVNDLLVQAAEPLFFLDYFATGKLSVEQAKHVIAGIAKGCLESGCALVGGETAEMPGMYQKGDYDLAGFSVGAVPRSQLLPRIQEMRVDDVLVGIPSSGLHSNGFSLVRKIIELHRIDLLSPSPFKSDLPSLAEELLKPTRLYVKSCLPLMRKGLVKGAAHITGGGLIENLPRVLPCGLGARIYSNSWESPPVFDWLVKSGNLDTYESFRTFNMGIGMVLIVDPQNVESILESIPDACVIGVLLPLNEGVSEIVQIDV